MATSVKCKNPHQIDNAQATYHRVVNAKRETAEAALEAKCQPTTANPSTAKATFSEKGR